MHDTLLFLINANVLCNQYSLHIGTGTVAFTRPVCFQTQRPIIYRTARQKEPRDSLLIQGFERKRGGQFKYIF